MNVIESIHTDFTKQFRDGDWQSDAHRQEAIAAVLTSGKIPFKSLLSIIRKVHPTEQHEEKILVRMTCLEELVKQKPDASIVPLILEMLDHVDAVSCKHFFRILYLLYQNELADQYVKKLKSKKPLVRAGMQSILSKKGGKTVFELLKEGVKNGWFTSHIEVMNILVKIAGHHSINIIEAITQGDNTEDCLHAITLLSNPNFMGQRMRRALMAIYKLISNDNPKIRLSVIEVIGQHGEEKDISILLDLLETEEKKNLQAVISAIGNIGTPDYIDYLIPFLKDSITSIRVATIKALSSFKDERSIEPIIEMLHDENLIIRNAAIDALGELGTQKNIRVGRLLVAMMRDKNVNVRRSIVEVIKKLGDHTNVWWKLIRYLRDEDWWVRELVTDVLAKLGGPRIAEPIVALLSDPNEIVRRYAIEVLMRIKEKKSIMPLVTCLNDTDWWVRERAVEALAVIGDSRVIPILNRRLEMDDDLIYTTVIALRKFADKSSYKYLLPLLNHPQPEVRIEVIKSLDAIGVKEFGQQLKMMINDNDTLIRNQVQELLPKYNYSIDGTRVKSFERMSIVSLNEMLMDVKRRGGNDLFILSGQKPYMKIRGDVEVLSDHVFEKEETETLLYDILSTIQREQLDNLEDIDMSYSIANDLHRFRVNIFRMRAGVGAVFRVLSDKIMTMKELNLPKPLFDFTKLQHGLVLITGPTGSGKSTTLAAMIDEMNRTRSDHIITIEDPIEYIHKNKNCIINQREVKTHTYSFSNALRSALREDPDIILVGEMRDYETISIAITAAETGHLVLGTLHTVSASKTIDRIIDVFPGGQQAQVRTMVAESIKGVVSQQLLKRKDKNARVMAMEIMICNDAISNLIRKEKIYQIPSIITTSSELGMRLMDNELLRLVKDGIIYPEDAYIKAVNKKEFEQFFEVDTTATVHDEQ